MPGQDYLGAKQFLSPVVFSASPAFRAIWGAVPGRSLVADSLGNATWQSPSLWLAPSGAVAETFSRHQASGTFTPVSTDFAVSAIGLAAGAKVSAITFCTGATPESGGSHGWYALTDSGGTVRAVSADQTGSAFWGASAAVPLAMTAPYVAPYSGPYYIGVSVTASGMPEFITGASPLYAAPNSLTPVICGDMGTGYSTPPAAGTGLGTITPRVSHNLYGYVS